MDVFDRLPRAAFALTPTPLEAGPVLPGGSRLWVKRDDLTGLGVGGNKARKLEYLCGQAVADGADTLVTVGAAQSNHCRMTAAAGAVLGLDVHLVLSGDAPAPGHLTGNQLLSQGFGAQLHFTGAGDHEWGMLEIAREQLTDALTAQGCQVASIPIGGSTAVGAIGYARALVELTDQCTAAGVDPDLVVVTTSSGGTHAGLLAGQTLLASHGRTPPEVIAVAVARGVARDTAPVVDLARGALDLLGVHDDLVAAPRVDSRFLGDDYAIPTAEGDAAIRWAARHGGWVLDRVYTGKGFAGLLAVAGEHAEQHGPGRNVVWIHTGGLPTVFTPGGWPL
jgi:1-aminocyclopropane-1-carboxylate deaminase/D-cysteine desulfhydrase-like pyridoxal-dependent ACC family enzyme